MEDLALWKVSEAAKSSTKDKKALESSSQLTLTDIQGPLTAVDNEPDRYTRAELRERARIGAYEDSVGATSRCLSLADIAPPRRIPNPSPDRLTRIEMIGWAVTGPGAVPATLPFASPVGTTLRKSQEATSTATDRAYLATRTFFLLGGTMAVFGVVALFHELSKGSDSLSYLAYLFFTMLALSFAGSWHRMIKARYPLSSGDDSSDDGPVGLISSVTRIVRERSRE